MLSLFLIEDKVFNFVKCLMNEKIFIKGWGSNTSYIIVLIVQFKISKIRGEENEDRDQYAWF